MGQMTIFDMVSVDETDFRFLTIEDIVSRIENATGLVFERVGDTDVYKAKVKYKEFDVHLSRYVFNNEPFISCGYWNKKELEGCGYPCDSLSDAIQFFRKRK